MRPQRGQGLPPPSTCARAPDRDRRDRQAACARPARTRRRGIARCPPRGWNVPSGKNATASPSSSASQDAPRVAAALVAIGALDEVVAEAVQQEADERQARGFLLDHEAEARRQQREEERPVEVARMIRDDDAGARRQAFEPGRAHAKAAEPEVRAADRARRGPARLEAGQGEDRQGGEQDHRQREQVEPRAPTRAAAGSRSCRETARRGCGYCELVPVMLMVMGVCETGHGRPRPGQTILRLHSVVPARRARLPRMLRASAAGSRTGP